MIDQGDKAECALRFHDLGLVVVPVHFPVKGHCSCRAAWTCGSPAKHPACSWGSMREQSVSGLLAMLGEYPQHNLGVSLAGSDLVVLDVDPAEGGDQAMAQFVDARGCPLPPTLQVVTGAGARHLYFRVPTDMHLVGVDVPLVHGVHAKARSGMVVIPPSRSATGGQYAFAPGCPVAPADLPIDLLRRLHRSSRVGARARQRRHPTLHAPGRAERSVTR